MDTKSSYDWTVSLKDSTKSSKFERTKERKIIIIITLITGYDSGSAKEGRNVNEAEKNYILLSRRCHSAHKISREIFTI